MLASGIAMTYGHRHLGFFFMPLVETTDAGFRYRGTDYTWKQVVKATTWTAPAGWNVGVARERDRGVIGWA
jgi:hypothetical protein